jgi:hypothetical protein
MALASAKMLDELPLHQVSEVEDKGGSPSAGDSSLFALILKLLHFTVRVIKRQMRCALAILSMTAAANGANDALNGCPIGRSKVVQQLAVG